MLICQGILRNQLRLNSLVPINEKQYLYLKIITKSQLNPEFFDILRFSFDKIKKDNFQ